MTTQLPGLPVPTPPPTPTPPSGGATGGRDFLFGVSGDELLDGLAGDDVLSGAAGADTLIGGLGNDALFGEEGADSLLGGPGDDEVSGGDGRDIAGFAGPRAASTVARGAGGLTVTGADGRDVLTGVERLAFADGVLAFDDAGAGGQAYRLYQAAFARTPDAAGLGFWVRGLEGGGFDLLSAAAFFAASPEFLQRYGALDDRGFVLQLYRNVLGREGEAGGVAFWTETLAGGAPRGQVLVGFSESAENQALVAPRISDGFWYV